MGKPVGYFKKGMDAIEKEPVSELTWKLAFALGREFDDRGQKVKARETLRKAKVVLQFIVSQFHSDDRKKAYLALEGRGRVLDALGSYLNK